MRFLIFALLSVGFISCVSHKKIILLQSATQSDTISTPVTNYKVKPNDRLFIRVSSFNKEVTEFFNIQNNNTGATMAGPGMAQMSSFLVNKSGYVELPMFDSISVSGLTIPQIQDTLQLALRKQVEDAFVMVSLANFQVTVMGEVMSEGIVTSARNQMTVYDAIALAGGLDDYADRKHVRIVRTEGGDTRFVTVDLTDRGTVKSDYYYLYPDDLVYVERLKAITFLNNLNTFSRVFGILVGLILLERVFLPN